jgi:hypothetical protein
MGWRRRLALVLMALVQAGCAFSSVSVGIPAYRSGGQLEADVQACEQDATGSDEFERRRAYMACMIVRGYRTYVSVATYWHMAELTVGAARGRTRNEVLQDLSSCATDAGGVAGARPLELAEAVDWVSVTLLRLRERVRDGSLFPPVAQCLRSRGYTAEVVKRGRNVE